MERAPWRYTGSRFVRDGRPRRMVYAAREYGVLISVYADADAVAETCAAGSESDETFEIRADVIPPVGTRVRVILEREPHPPRDR